MEGDPTSQHTPCRRCKTSRLCCRLHHPEPSCPTRGASYESWLQPDEAVWKPSKITSPLPIHMTDEQEETMLCNGLRIGGDAICTHGAHMCV
jgi:hypothetical protein